MAEVFGVLSRKPNSNLKNIIFEEKNVDFCKSLLFFADVLESSQGFPEKNVQPIWFSRLASYS